MDKVTNRHGKSAGQDLGKDMSKLKSHPVKARAHDWRPNWMSYCPPKANDVASCSLVNEISHSVYAYSELEFFNVAADNEGGGELNLARFRPVLCRK